MPEITSNMDLSLVKSFVIDASSSLYIYGRIQSNSFISSELFSFSIDLLHAMEKLNTHVDLTVKSSAYVA